MDDVSRSELAGQAATNGLFAIWNPVVAMDERRLGATGVFEPFWLESFK